MQLPRMVVTSYKVSFRKSYDIVPIVNYGWLHSFARTRTNKSAIAVRGWNPLNRALLQHPEIAGTAAQQAEEIPTSAASFLPEDINTKDGSAGDMFDILLRNAEKEQAKKGVSSSSKQVNAWFSRWRE